MTHLDKIKKALPEQFAKDYYTAPSNEVFEDIKINAIKIWLTYDDNYGYATGKINKITGMRNISDNAWYIVAMFDRANQMKLIHMVSFETAKILEDLLFNQ